MTEFFLYALAALILPVGSVILVHIVTWQFDRELDRSRRERMEHDRMDRERKATVG